MIDSKGCAFGCRGLSRAGLAVPRKRKAGASSGTPNEVSYSVNYTRKWGKAKGSRKGGSNEKGEYA